MKNGSSEGLVAMRDDIAQLVIHNFFVRPARLNRLLKGLTIKPVD